MLKLLKLMELVDSPETAGEFINELVSTYKPVIYTVIGEFFNVYKDLNNNDEYFAEVARNKQRHLDAYLAAGFSREEAMLFMLDSELRKKRTLDMFKQATAQASGNIE